MFLRLYVNIFYMKLNEDSEFIQFYYIFLIKRCDMIVQTRQLCKRTIFYKSLGRNTDKIITLLKNSFLEFMES